MILENDTSVTALPVMESFYTLQGEGFHTGKAAYFVRLGGCDVGCVWCDVKESWDADAHPLHSIGELTSTIKTTPAEIVVITGGEPFIHDLEKFSSSLKNAGLKVHVETSGSSPLSGTIDWVCLSPKKFKAPLPEAVHRADELKVVVFNKTDFAWAESFAEQVSADCKLYLQPEWSRAETITPLIVDYILQHPNWQLSLQTHKYIGVP